MSAVRFSCRPACALCCYANPATTSEERGALLQIDPEVGFLPGPAGYAYIESRGHGGACGFLRAERCRAHVARPFPCQEYPLTVHVGDRVQVTVVLDCPGIDLEFLDALGDQRALSGAPAGLNSELDAVRSELRAQPVDRWIDEGRKRFSLLRRRWGRSGFWTEPGDVRAALASELPLPGPNEFPVEAPPGSDADIETLPIFYDEGYGRVAIREHPGGYELMKLHESGASPDPIGVFPFVESPPPLSAAATRRLRGYLSYWLARDQLFWGLFAGPPPHGTLSDAVSSELREIGATVLTRGWVRSRARGSGSDELGVTGVEEGIRATDADFLDRPTAGRVL